MIDLKLLTDNPDEVKRNNEARGAAIDISVAKGLAEERLQRIREVEDLRAQANDVAASIPSASDDERAGLVEKGKTLKEQLKGLEEKLKETEDALQTEMAAYPNILRGDVPVGEDEKANKEMHAFLEPTKFSFEPKDHLELGEALGLVDMERAAKVSGARFAYKLGDAVLLEHALIQYALSILVPEGFVPVLPPHIISTDAMRAMGYMDQAGSEEVYQLKDDDAVLIGTSEQAIGPMFMNETLKAEDLPLRFVGFSPCYRREAGSYGKDTRGLIRTHQFDKIEMFSFTHPDDSDKEHEFLLSLQERLMQGLKLPYKVMKLSSGDTGYPSARTYDIETWMPGQDAYRETSSTSNTTDFQTRRLNIRYKGKDGKGFVHALNGTAFAMSRTPIAIMENYQQEDGSIVVPDVLRPWMGKDKMSKM